MNLKHEWLIVTILYDSPPLSRLLASSQTAL